MRFFGVVRVFSFVRVFSAGRLSRIVNLSFEFVEVQIFGNLSCESINSFESFEISEC